MIPLELHAALWLVLAAAGALVLFGYVAGAARRRRTLDRAWIAGRAKGRAEGITRGRAGMLAYCEDRLTEGLQLQLGADGPYWAAPGPSGRWAPVRDMRPLEHARGRLPSQGDYRAGLAAIVADLDPPDVPQPGPAQANAGQPGAYAGLGYPDDTDSSGPLDLLDAEIMAYMADKADTSLWRLRAETDHRLFCYANRISYAPIDWDG